MMSSNGTWTEEVLSDRRDSLYIVLPITVLYAVIFFTGLIGNISTCVVIARNKSMHTATNYYLFSLAVSDLLLLVSGLPSEMYYIWSNFPYVFGEAFCIVQSFSAETSANATVLTITAFTVERYVAICHPFISHTMSKLSRAVKFVVVIWLLALCLAVPQAIQFGIIYENLNGTVILDSARCSIRYTLIDHAFVISTILFFGLPMTIITVLYVLIAIKLRRSSLLTSTASKGHRAPGGLNQTDSYRGKTNAQKNVIRMLVAVVVAFFICWAPFHAQRLLAVYAQSRTTEPEGSLVLVYTTLTYVSGVFYYLSTTVNPLLYNIMSNKFREAFKSMLPKRCIRKSHRGDRRQPIYSSLSRCQRSMRHRNDDTQHSPSISVSDEQQRLTHIMLAKANSCQPNGLAKSRSEQQVRPVTATAVKESARRPEYARSMSRGSNSSQLTMMTTLSKQDVNNKSNNNNTASECLLKIHKSPKAVTLAGILTERLGLGKKGFFIAKHRKSSPVSPTKPENAPPASRFQSHPSIESTNTISNSSLQDLDENEFTGSELAQYMGELNCDLVT